MSNYPIVAYQTAGGKPLRDVLYDLMQEDPEASFKLLIPATRTQHLFTWTEGESNAVAQEKADAAAAQLSQSGVPLTGVAVGDPDPFVAVTNELAVNPDFTAIIVSTFPAGVSRWLRLDLPTRLERKTGLPVTHVVVEPETG